MDSPRTPLDVELLARAMMEALTPGFREGPGSKGYKKLHRQRAERIAAEYLRLQSTDPSLSPEVGESEGEDARA